MITGQPLIKFFEACKHTKCLTQLHSLIIKTGLTHHTFYAAKLINLYSKLTPLQTARHLFDETPHRNVYFWNSILKCYSRQKQYKETLSLFSHLFSSRKPDNYTILIALKACARLKALEFGKIIHGFVKKSDLICGDLFVGSGLVEFYSKCGEMDDAYCVFDEYSEPDTVLWTTMITGYEQNGDPKRAVEVFSQMVKSKGVVVDPITLVSVVSACARMVDLKAGRTVHGYMIRMGFENGLSLSNALLNLYGKTGSVNAAAKLFEKMEEKDVISWGSMIACYAHHGGACEALDFFNRMVDRGIESNTVVLISALQACEATCNLEEGKKIHEIAARKGLDVDILVSTALIDMYMTCFCPREAINVFERMPEKDYVSFSSLLRGYALNGMALESVAVFCDMLGNNFRPHAFDVVKILTACSELGVLRQTSCIHGFVIRNEMDKNSFIGASLIESYAKCGSLDDSIEVFSGIETRDVVIWSSMLAAYGSHGKGREALELFNLMIKHSEIRPNEVLFVSILSACSHAGLVKEGIEIFNMMVKDYGLAPNSKHYGIVADILGRIGEVEKSMEFINQVEESVGAHVWGALLGACRIYQNTEIGEIAVKKMQELDPGQVGHYILLSNMYAVDEKWDNVDEVRKLVKEKELKKVSGRSVIELRDEVCSFVANDRSHQDCEKIYELMRRLEGKMKEESL
ncbi:hypothetical protein BUALT_Bualt16G0016200 [Buddleja alternifolia]|uniref:Pentatricopeptide repeat-containing protein n=1 Tax=Buddleja alternifolia TaxID=168488 RepID=A0AAV6WHK0_9LAMI|nr:hypothetical protein BUALT_Bualt16G0016200 [Buddleja alternifolia]